MKDEWYQTLTDEKGKLSAARVLLLLHEVFTATLIVFDVVMWGSVSSDVYSLLGVIFTGLLAWSAGPRIAQYLLPQIGAVAQGIASAVTVREPRQPEIVDNDPRFRDVEG